MALEVLAVVEEQLVALLDLLVGIDADPAHSFECSQLKNIY